MSDERPEAKAAERYRALLEINNAIVANLTQEALFGAIARSLRRLLPFDRAAIYLSDPAHRVLRLYALEASSPSANFAVGTEMPAEDSHVGWVFRHQKVLLRRDLRREREFPADELVLADGYLSYVLAPMIVRGQVIGTLNVGSQTPNQYSSEDADFLQEVANQIALAIENMKSFEEIASLKKRLERENIYLQEEIRQDHGVAEMIGRSPALRELMRQVEKVAPTDTTVLICGETGTGKELVARALHERSARRARPLVKVNCSAISAGLVESELFGHVKGAFTGAFERRIGRFELADKGTIFLDEVGELLPETQVKLLRVLQEREFEPVGSSQSLQVDVRVIAATNRDLQQAIQAGRFRSDLYYRLNVLPLHLPPLRDRRSDIPLLASYFVSRFARRFGKPIEGIAPETMAYLTSYSWPGNIRELQNVVERAIVLCKGPLLEVDPQLLSAGPLPADPVNPKPRTSPPPASSQAPPGPATLEELERAHIMAVLRQTGGVIEGSRGAAQALGLHPSTLRSRMRKLGIPRRPREIS